MKVQIEEYGAVFSFNFEPESIADAAMLVRLKLNGTKELKGIWVTAHEKGTIEGSISIGKRKQVTSYMK
jgi:hypothetical protein